MSSGETHKLISYFLRINWIQFIRLLQTFGFFFFSPAQITVSLIIIIVVVIIIIIIIMNFGVLAAKQ